MKFAFSALLLLLLVFGCTPKQNNLTTLTGYMTGSFSSQQQAAGDSSFHDIRLEMVRIWSERADGVWMYVEQASAEHLDRPYRQRIYHLTQQSDSVLQSTVYTFDDVLSYAGAWKSENPLSELSPDNLVEREGCAVYLKEFSPGVFVGSTESLNCSSDLRGAAYTTSIVLINQNQI